MSELPKSPALPPVLPEGELLLLVRQTAEELAAQLAAGERATHGWADEGQTRLVVDAAAGALLDRLSATGCWGEANRLPSGELWRIAGGWLDTGSLQRQARFKPRGYAGDYDLLAKVCDGWRCDDPLGRAFDAFFQNQAAPRAVRHRTNIVAEAIVGQCRQNAAGDCHVVSVGSGPARDVEQALSLLSTLERARVRVTLLDLDPLALEYAAARLSAWLPAERLVCQRENLFRLPRNPRVSALLRGASIISCAGFFDYLADADAAALLTAFWQMLAPAGRLLVFNFTPDNPSRAYMEWIGNWYLIYRSLADLAGLARQVGLPETCFQVAAEELGVDGFLSIEKGP